MKHYKFYLLFLLLTLLCFSCTDDSVFVNLDQTSFVVDAKGGSEIINVTASGDWSVSDIPEWVFMNTTSGRKDTEIKIDIAGHKAQNSRDTTLIFSCGEKTQALQIQQLGLKESEVFLELDVEEARVGVDGNQFRIELTANRK